ncbi:MAG: response regulator transcription factor [Acidimicrobiia bacterium]|nr:response regulator transcription factor [Acidimicrobiia bacterium]
MSGFGRLVADVLVVDDRAVVAQAVAAALVERGHPARVMVEPLLGGDVPDAGEPPGVAVVALDDHAPALVRTLVGAGWRCVVLGPADRRLEIAACLEAGALGHVGYGDGLDELVAALDAVGIGVTRLMAEHDRQELFAELRTSRSASARALAPFDRLTPREREVLAGLVDGARADDIAAASFVSVATVRNQIQSVLTKLDVRSQLEAVAKANRAGWRG